MSDKPTREFANRLAKALADEGKLIEAGWLGLRAMCVPPGAPQVQIDAMRFAYMSGAQHVFGSIMNSFDPGEEPTDADMRRLDLIAAELDAFEKELRAGAERERMRRGGHA